MASDKPTLLPRRNAKEPGRLLCPFPARPARGPLVEDACRVSRILSGPRSYHDTYHGLGISRLPLSITVTCSSGTIGIDI